MCPVSEDEIHEIVHRVIEQTLSLSKVQTVSQILETVPPPPPSTQAQTKPAVATSPKGLVAIAADHGGFEMKEDLKSFLLELGYNLTDCGTKDKQPVDYPDFAHTIATMVSEGKAWRGIVIDGAGIGSCITANKVPGVRAAMCYDHATALNSREHNNANVLTLGAALIGTSLARQIVKTWLSTEFQGGRHAKRVDKIIEIEKKYQKVGK